MARIGKILFTLSLLGLLPLVANAAAFSFSPASASYAAGDTFAVSVSVGTSGQAINAVSGTVSFPTDLLSVVSISKSGSILSLWVQEPSFSNSAGTVTFEGIVPNPGFTGSFGNVITITFRVKASGTASLTLSNASILANDGIGTNVLTSSGTARFVLTDSAPVAPVTPPSKSPAKPAVTSGDIAVGLLIPEVVSSTHPDEHAWYTGQDAEFSWALPSGVKAVRLSFDTLPVSDTTVLYDPPIAKKSISNVKDGTSYIHVQFKDKSGWGDTANFRIQVDTAAPEPFTITFHDGPVVNGVTTQSIAFHATDALSGINHYVVQIDGKEYASVPFSSEDARFVIPQELTGTHTLTVEAFDEAGNVTTATSTFIFKSVSGPFFSPSPYLLWILLGVLLMLLFALLYLWHKYVLLRYARSLEKNAIPMPHPEWEKSLALLRKEMKNQIKIIEKMQIRKGIGDKNGK